MRKVSAKIVKYLGEISQARADFIHIKGEQNAILEIQDTQGTAEEWEKYMKESVHDTPLMLLPEREEVRMAASTFAAYKKKKNSKAVVNIVRD
jgi:hypothetical protein